MSDYEYSNRDPLHVVHIISGLGHGGAETVLHRLLTAPIQSDRHCVISMGDAGVFGPRLRAAGIAVYTLDMKSPVGAVKGLWRMHQLLRQLRPDVVQTWMYHADLIGGVVARLAGIEAVSWGIRNSGADLSKSSRSARVLSWLCARVSRLVPAVIVACAENAAQRHQQWGYRADRMLVIPNGYDLTCWQPDPAARASNTITFTLVRKETTTSGRVSLIRRRIANHLAILANHVLPSQPMRSASHVNSTPASSG